MYFTQMQGQLLADHSFSGPAKAFTTVEADGAIPVGSPTVSDVGSTAGKLVVVGAAATGFRFRGVYNGVGGTGATTSATGLSGKAAVDGDIIQVQLMGPVSALLDGTVDVADGDPIEVGAGAFVKMVASTTTLLEGYRVIGHALEAYTTNSAAAKSVLLLF